MSLNTSASGAVSGAAQSVDQSQTAVRDAPYRQLLVGLVSGAGAGAITKTAVAPLDRVKILMQVEGMLKAETGGEKYGTSVTRALRTIVQQDGFLALYQGNFANVVRVIPVYALKFGFNDTFTAMVRKPGQTRADLGFHQLMAAGSLAGLFQTIITYPLEFIRTRLTLDRSMGSNYKGIVDCFRHSVREEGWTSLYKGISPTLFSGGPYVGLQMSFYELFRRAYPKDPETGKANLFWKLAGGASAGVCAQAITYPFDTVRRRMQTNGMGGRPKKYVNTWDCFQTMLRKEGVRALYRGMNATIARAIPGAAIQFASYDSIKQLFGGGSSGASAKDF